MKITKIVLDGYKRFKHLTLDLGSAPSRIIALIGPNGSGKSAIFDAMLFKVNAYGQIGNKNSKDYKFHSMLGEPNYDQNNVQIEFDAGSFTAVMEEKRNLGVLKTVLSFRNSYRYNSSVNVKTTTALDDIKQNSYGATYSTDIDDKMSENYQRLQSKFEKYIRSNPVTFDQAKAVIISDLNKAISNCLEIQIEDVGSVADGKGTIFFTKAGQSLPFEFDVLSSGEKEVVDILLDLYLRKDEYNDTIYIIDEPELHLNTSIQRHLLLEIDKLVPQNCQIRVATHSIGFLRALQEELNDKSSIIEFTSSIPTESLTPMGKTRKNWQRIFQTALDDLTGLIAPQKLIYCEGRPDSSVAAVELGFDAICYNSIFSEEFPSALFISSDGCVEVEKYSGLALKVLQKAFLNTNIVKLIDRDERSPEEVAEELTKGTKILERHEIENYLIDKEVVKKYCDINSYKFDDAQYDSIFPDINGDIKLHIGEYIKTLIPGNKKNTDFLKELANCISADMLIYGELKRCIF